MKVLLGLGFRPGGQNKLHSVTGWGSGVGVWASAAGEAHGEGFGFEALVLAGELGVDGFLALTDEFARGHGLAELAVAKTKCETTTCALLASGDGLGLSFGGLLQDFLHLVQRVCQCFFVEGEVGEVFQDGEVAFLVLGDGEEAVDEFVFAGVGVVDGEADELFGLAAGGPGGEGEVEIPGDEDEAVGGWVQIEIVVVAEAKVAIEIGEEGVGGEEAEEGLDIEEGADIAGEGVVIGLIDELGEGDEAFFLVGGWVLFGFVAFLVGFPVVAHVGGSGVEALGFEEHAGAIAEVFFEEGFVDLFDEGEDADEFVVVFAGDGEGEFGEGGAGYGYAGLAEEGVGECLAGLGGVGDAGVEVEHGEAVELLVVDVAVEVDLEGFFEGLLGGHEGVVALVADADLFEGLAVPGEFALGPGEVDAEGVAVGAFLRGLGFGAEAGKLELGLGGGEGGELLFGEGEVEAGEFGGIEELFAGLGLVRGEGEEEEE